MKKIGILGGGWLGLALALEAKKKEHQIKVTSTSEERVKLLIDKGLDTQFLKLTELAIMGPLDFFKEIETLIITIPPGLRKNPQGNYVALVEQIIEKVEAFKIRKVLFTSSTSVYGFQEGIITETSELFGDSPSAQQIIKVEQKLINNKNFEGCIVRLGGLMGPDRHPIFTLSGKKNLPNPLSPINFIHQKDAIAILLNLVENWNENQIYNAVTPYHPGREAYYSKMAEIAQLEPPNFEKTGTIRGFVSSEKVCSELHYTFKVKNLLILN
jgi:nucleoside-diphosphate-sugar epimerase